MRSARSECRNRSDDEPVVGERILIAVPEGLDAFSTAENHASRRRDLAVLAVPVDEGLLVALVPRRDQRVHDIRSTHQPAPLSRWHCRLVLISRPVTRTSSRQINSDYSPGRTYPLLADTAARTTSVSSVGETNSWVATERMAPLLPTTRATAAAVLESGALNTAMPSRS